MRRTLLFLSLLITFQLPGQVDQQLLSQSIDPDSIDFQLLSNAVIKAANEVRTKRGLPALKPDSALKVAAGIQAEYLLDRSNLVHINGRAQYETPAKRVQSTGADPSSVAENLAAMGIYDLGKSGRFFVTDDGNPVSAQGRAFSTLTYKELARKVTEGWLQSKGHRKNLLGNYSHIGVAVGRKISEKEMLPTLVFVQNFGKY